MAPMSRKGREYLCTSWRSFWKFDSLYAVITYAHAAFDGGRTNLAL
jgi:hypothetical protein